jgi:hypothetical protein
MTSFITTMFVNTSPSYMHPYPSPPKPLEPVFSPVASSSCVQLPLPLLPQTPCKHSQHDSVDCLPRLPPPLHLIGSSSAQAQTQTQEAQSDKQAGYASPIHLFFHAALRSFPFAQITAQTAVDSMAELHNVNDEDDHYRNSRTRAPFRPQKSGKGSTNWQLKQFAEATLGSGSLRKAVKLPEGEDEGEWLAVNGMSHYASYA